MIVGVDLEVTSVLLRLAVLPSAHVLITSITPSGIFCASGIATNLALFIFSKSYHTAVSDKCSIVCIQSLGSSAEIASINTVFPVPL